MQGKKSPRQLKDLVSIGPAMLRDFESLGIRTVEELAQNQAEELYDRLCKITRQHHDICVLDTFHAAVAQARTPASRPPSANGGTTAESASRKHKKARKSR